MKQRAIKLWAGLFLLAASCAVPDLQAEEPPLRWAADAEGGAPYIFKDPNDESRYLGFEVELAAALEKQLGRRIEFRQYSFDSLALGLARGDFDFAMNGLEVTPDRQERLRLSRPYYTYRLQLVTRADETRFYTLAECKALGGTVGTMGETSAARLLEQRGIARRIYDGQVEPYIDLELGRIDAVLLDELIAVYYALPNKKLRMVGEPFGEGQYAIGFRKDQEELAAKFDTALQNLEDSGELRRIAERWEAPRSDVLGDSRRTMIFSRYFPMLCKGALVTIQLSLASMALAMMLGLPISLARLYGPAPVRGLAIAYVECFRGIPVLLLLYVLYYGLPTLSPHLELPAFTAAVIAFGLNYAAYEAEIYRSGIGAIPLGQWEAAASLGMSRVQTFRRIIFPQSLRTILPPVTNDFVALFKDTSLASIITLEELNKQYQLLSKSSLKYFEIGAITALLYLVMSVPLGYLARALEKRWGKA
jgi:polar amino acid transport system substrate-binding protein